MVAPATREIGTRRVADPRRWLLAAVLLCLAISALALFDPGNILVSSRGWVEQHSILGPFLYAALYIVATVLLVPGAVMTLAGGALFGVVGGTLMVSIASTTGATLAFLTGRYVARDWAVRKTRDNPAFDAIDRGIQQDGWKIVCLVRLSPMFPFTFLNYAFGVTSIRLRDYVLASWIGMIPGTVVYVYLGAIALDGARDGAAGRPYTAAEWVLHGTGLVATVAVTAMIARRARRAMDQYGPTSQQKATGSTSPAGSNTTR